MLRLIHPFSQKVRKLFEPHLYPDSPLTKVFDRAFGPARCEREAKSVCSYTQRQARLILSSERASVCAVGFEPNPRHEFKLRRLEEAYRRCGWRTTYARSVPAFKDIVNNNATQLAVVPSSFLASAVGVVSNSSRADLYTDDEPERMEWGASIVPREGLRRNGTVGHLYSCREFLVP